MRMPTFCATLRPRCYAGERGERELPLPLAVGANKVMKRKANQAPAVHLVFRERAQRQSHAMSSGEVFGTSQRSGGASLDSAQDSRSTCLYADTFVLWLRPTDVRLIARRFVFARVLSLPYLF